MDKPASGCILLIIIVIHWNRRNLVTTYRLREQYTTAMMINAATQRTANAATAIATISPAKTVNKQT